MIAQLQSVYYDDNRAAKAREELRTLKYDLYDKSTDIHQFIAKIDILANRANIV